MVSEKRESAACDRPKTRRVHGKGGTSQPAQPVERFFCDKYFIGYAGNFSVTFYFALYILAIALVTIA